MKKKIGTVIGAAVALLFSASGCSEKVFNGVVDSPLTEKGKHQMECFAKNKDTYIFPTKDASIFLTGDEEKTTWSLIVKDEKEPVFKLPQDAQKKADYEKVDPTTKSTQHAKIVETLQVSKDGTFIISAVRANGIDANYVNGTNPAPLKGTYTLGDCEEILFHLGANSMGFPEDFKLAISETDMGKMVMLDYNSDGIKSNNGAAEIGFQRYFYNWNDADFIYAGGVFQ